MYPNTVGIDAASRSLNYRNYVDDRSAGSDKILLLNEWYVYFYYALIGRIIQ